MQGLISREKENMNPILRRLMLQAGWRSEEPAVVFESDDWGLIRHDCGSLVEKYGPPIDWAREETEKEEDLDALFRCLSAEKDAHGRPACFTANFVMANPDPDAMRQENYRAYHDRSIREQLPPALLETYREGIRSKVFYPQYHGRYSASPEAWLRDLRTGADGARFFLDAGFGPALTFVKGSIWRYHSEYLDWESGRQPAAAEIEDFMRKPLEDFEVLFGYRPESTIAPHYIFTGEAEKAWKKAGIRFVQGAGYRPMRKSGGGQKISGHFLGEPSSEGLTLLIRTVKFDPRPARPQHHWKNALAQCEACFRAGLPAVIDTHRINYTGRFREEGISQLACLLEGLRPFRPNYMTTPELGSAIVQDGGFRDVFSGSARTLRPKAEAGKKLAQAAVHLWRKACPQ
jgi:hypothetical protein